MPPKEKKPKFVPITEDWGTLDETESTGTGLDMSFSLTLSPSVEATTQRRHVVTPSTRQTSLPQRSHQRQPPATTDRPLRESYVLPTQAPFTARIVNAPLNVTKNDIRRTFSSLSVTDVRPNNRFSGKKSGNIYVDFQDVDGLKQCLDKYWMFEINGRPIRTYVADAPKSTATCHRVTTNLRGVSEPLVIPSVQQKPLPNHDRGNLSSEKRHQKGQNLSPTAQPMVNTTTTVKGHKSNVTPPKCEVTVPPF
ncbi:hypothetical protein GEMRC1_010014 [Eukaryota sp. GEM-RC1]